LDDRFEVDRWLLPWDGDASLLDFTDKTLIEPVSRLSPIAYSAQGEREFHAVVNAL